MKVAYQYKANGTRFALIGDSIEIDDLPAERSLSLLQKHFSEVEDVASMFWAILQSSSRNRGAQVSLRSMDTRSIVFYDEIKFICYLTIEHSVMGGMDFAKMVDPAFQKLKLEISGWPKHGKR